MKIRREKRKENATRTEQNRVTITSMERIEQRATSGIFVGKVRGREKGTPRKGVLMDVKVGLAHASRSPERRNRLGGR